MEVLLKGIFIPGINYLVLEIYMYGVLISLISKNFLDFSE